jgi:putative nucleotidyltransferase with HDIG domain
MKKAQMETITPDAKTTNVDILDTKHPLMILLREKAPGTYSHSKNVASLMETLATELGLDVRKVKIAAHYHDIGKALEPTFFTENQDNVNPHDLLDPDMSFRIISSHVGETIQILVNEPQIPHEVLQWCSQHHGCSVMRYFFTKSKTNDSAPYRYKCSKPKSLEAALLMITDHLEARSRSLVQAGKMDNISGLIELVIAELLDDGQLDEVILRLGDLRIIKNTLKAELDAQFHKRVDYDAAEGK